ncbi:MAG: hydroxymyristoyl-ACP dehydratase [Mediterranea sp.]|jgi:3-hydroxyacyl-[acyl-carrier-protein] dehydratase|nr:hydroxymyristoyl-ACP dehydratase [Mediterranea sp.]
MMLLKDFYTLLSTEAVDDHTSMFRLELNPSHALYQGHFPGHPVVPGVCQLQLLKECLEGLLSQPLQYARIASCKFLSALNPQATPQLSFTLDCRRTEAGLFLLKAEGVAGGTCFLKLKATLTPVQR